MINQQLKEYLDQNQVEYEVIPHHRSFAAQFTAAAAHIPGRDLAKVTMIKIDGTMAMAVLPASDRIDFEELKSALHLVEGEVELAEEEEFMQFFPDCETGAMPPFGNLYGMKVYMADSLAADDWIAFNAGSHTELIKISYQDYEQLVEPALLHFTFQTPA